MNGDFIGAPQTRTKGDSYVRSHIMRPTSLEYIDGSEGRAAGGGAYVGGSEMGGPSGTGGDYVGGSKLKTAGDVAEHVEYSEYEKPPEPRGAWAKTKRHCARWWCVYAVIIFIGLAAGLPILFLVILPAIAQRVVNDADLPVFAANILDPAPMSFVASLVAGLKVPLGIHGTVSPFDLELYVKDPTDKGKFVPYVALTIPETKIRGSGNLTVDNQKVTIQNKTEMVSFLKTAVDSESFDLSARGEADIHLGKLKYHVKLDKTVNLRGLNRLQGFAINMAAVVLPPLEDGTNLLGNVTIPNHSIVTFDMGNVTLNMLSGDLWIGTADIMNVSLSPGNNTFELRGKADLPTIFRNLPRILAGQMSNIARGMIGLNASGNQTFFNGERIDWYDAVLRELVIGAEVPIFQILTDTVVQMVTNPDSPLAGLLPGLGNLDLGGLLGAFSNITIPNTPSATSTGGVVSVASRTATTASAATAPAAAASSGTLDLAAILAGLGGTGGSG